jgi:hypothetical protein
LHLISLGQLDYLNRAFLNPDPWRYFTSNYEQLMYKRQIDIILDRMPNPARILEVGSAEVLRLFCLQTNFPMQNDRN